MLLPSIGQVLLMALGMTAATVGFIFVLATTTSFDFTRLGARTLFLPAVMKRPRHGGMLGLQSIERVMCAGIFGPPSWPLD